MANESKPRGRPRKDGKPAGSVPKKPKGPLGGAREGAGRPLGSKNIFSRDSVKKLEELDFDPIEKLVELYYRIQDDLMNGNVRAGSGAYAQLLATQNQIMNSLMSYGYRRVPERQEVEIENKKPLAVKLNLKKGNKDG